MMRLRRGEDRPRTRLDWLDSRHGFSFGQHHDPAWMGFGALRVLNEDVVAGGGGFAPHRHANMEIISIVLEGGLAHRDSTGASGVLRAGDAQVMSAGHGIEHAEFNASPDDPVHFLQLWIQPDRVNAEPIYAQAHFDPAQADGGWQTLVGEGALAIRQSASIHRARLQAGASLLLPARDAGRGCWLQVIGGDVELVGHALQAGDGLGVIGPAAQSNLIAGKAGVDLIRIDLPL